MKNAVCLGVCLAALAAPAPAESGTVADLTSQNFNTFGNLLGDPIFIGLVADTPITGIRWAEAQEGNGGNEETALDNFLVVPIPEPATLVLLGAGLTGWVAVRRRMRKA